MNDFALPRPFRITLACYLLAAVALSAWSDPSNWPNYLGPDKSSISRDSTRLADSWPSAGPPELWKLEVHPGHGGTAIVDGKIYLMDRVSGETDVLKVVDLETGKILGESGIESPGRVSFPGSRGVPTVTDDHVFASGPMGVVAAWKRDDLSLLWSIDLIKEFGGEALYFGYTIHPQVYDDLLIISANAEDASVVALNADTGKVAWKTGGLYGSLASPIIRKFQSRDQILYISQELPEKPGAGGDPSIAGLDPKSGEVLWRYEEFQANIPIPPPLVVDDQTLFVTGGYKAGSQLLTFDGSEKPRSKTVSEWGSQICPPILYDEHIYFLTQENASLRDKRLWPDLGLYCITKDGERLWNTGAEPMFGRGSMILADGKLIIRDSFHGKLYLVRPDPEGYRQLAVANPFDHTRGNLKLWTPLAISKGLLVIRDERELKCLDLRKR